MPRIATLSVRVRLTLWYTLVLAIAMVALTVTMYVAMRRALEADLDAGLRHNVVALGERLREELADDDEGQEASDDIVGESHFYNLSLEIYDPDGNRVACSSALVGRPLARAVDLAAAPRLGDGVVKGALGDDALDREGVEVAAVAVEHPRDRRLWVVVAGAGRTPLAATLRLMRRIALTLVPLLLAMAVIGGSYLASRALAPVAAMAEQARRMGADRLGDRLAVPNPDDELGRLAATLNELLDRIESAFNRMREFVADASHELRTPVGVIRSGTAVALTPPVTIDECVDTLRVINDQTARLGRLVDDMFTLARADAGDPAVLRAAPVPVGELAASCAAAAAPLAAAAGVRVEVAALPEHEAYCSGDRVRLEQMLMNLLTNAIRHGGRGGRVDLGVRFEGRGANAVATITVADTGPGIPEPLREAVFERFVRLDAARSRETGGAGLGLSIARWIAEAHGGSVSVGDSPSGGAALIVVLPIAETADAGPERQPRGESVARESART